MTRAFRSAHSAQVLKMKLARKEGALLCFEILQVTLGVLLIRAQNVAWGGLSCDTTQNGMEMTWGDRNL